MTDRKKAGGRKLGVPNKVTQDARKAIALFVDGNAHRLTEWLDLVAKGDPKNDIKPNPAKAFDMFQSVVEYHVPKLGRMEVAGDQDNPLQHDIHLNVFGELLKNIKMTRQIE